ncbi:molybdopterin dehydrogenase FAD-binding [Caldithrix abyssi DSM 13497]|uniref:Carbon-monoxide dehydrogenase medium subunit n=1 Tax=Caldithrix abyssi DSM 13497 TaxID=880073 RepID=H1XV07_CALAY|nr:FAD binding domain-containing protein [Caldithrix abyssi]APF18877.1 carbon-monoxide dehydrogenase medium subunit [Caldithrix abyssi DSM 13497]EHO42840.1 molybdopterin dehydrogenase FAD-binding [Caldithrix abyssi DSM 13497]
MIPEIEYYKAQNLKETLEALDHFNSEARLIAGGTDIIPGFHINSSRFRDIHVLIDISQVPELTNIEWQDDGLHIGGAATFTSIVENSIIQEKYPLLVASAAQIGSVQIRNRATIAGNFVNNAPCADSVPPLLVYDAQIVVQSLKETRRLPLADFLLKPYKTQLQPQEVVKEIILPELLDDYRGEFYKLGRRRGVSISRITLAVLLRLEGNIISDMRIASGAVTPIGKRFPELENLAKGKPAEEEFLRELAVSLGRQVLDITGLRWSSAYKLPVLQQAFFNMMLKIISGNN